MVWNILLYYADIYFTNRLKSDHLYITYLLMSVAPNL